MAQEMKRTQEMPATAEAPPRSRSAKISDWLGNPWGYVLVLPAALLYFTFEIWPIIRGVLMAFSPFSWVVPETKGLLIFNGLENYRELYRTQEWRHSIWVTAKFTASALPANVLVAMFTAVMISKVTSGRWSAFFRIVSYLPVVLPVTSAMLLWRNLYESQYGYINYFLSTLLHIKTPPNWMGDPKWALFALVLPTVWKGFGQNTMLFLIGIYSVNRELYEAAAIDGAGGWQQFWKVTLPLLRPVMVLVLVLGTRVVSSAAESMILYGGPTGMAVTKPWGGPGQAALTSGLFAFGAAFTRADMRMGLAASASLILGLIGMFLTGIIFKALRAESA